MSMAGARQREWCLFLVVLIATDAACLGLGVGLAGVLRVGLDDMLPISGPATDRVRIASFVLVPVLLLLFWSRGLYERDHILVGTREYADVAHGVTYGIIAALAASYFASNSMLVSRTWVLLVWGLGIGCACAGRFTARRVVRRLRRRGLLHTRVVIVGASTDGLALAEQLLTTPDEGLDLVGFLDEYLPLGQGLLANVRVLGRPSDVVLGTRDQQPDEYILVPQALPHQRLEEISHVMVSRAGPVVRMVVSSSELLTQGLTVSERASVPLITLRRARIAGLDLVLKLAVDVLVATLALAVLAPAALVAVVRARCTGRDPLVLRYNVYAAGAGRTSLWLFSPRVSRWPPVRWTPALLAVLLGRLSLVGPRPMLWQASQPAPLVLCMTTVKPGLTGPWRLTGPLASVADQARQDLSYVRSYTVWEDVRILWESLRCLWSDWWGGLLGRWEQISTAG
jgi:lipopolysaccharide/colanic/teichoic acid biosynthesis glycosyltransferase